MQHFALQDVNWTRVVWITCGLLWCFYQLFGLSFWRHPFTAEDLLVIKWYNATFLQIHSDEETNSCMAWKWVYFQNIFVFGCYFFNKLMYNNQQPIWPIVISAKVLSETFRKITNTNFMLTHSLLHMNIEMLDTSALPEPVLARFCTTNIPSVKLQGAES